MERQTSSRPRQRRTSPPQVRRQPPPSQLESLLAFSRELLAASDLRSLAAAAARMVHETLKVAIVSLMTPDAEGRHLVLHGGLGWDPSHFGRYRLPVEGSREGHVFRTGRPVQQQEVPRGEPFACPAELSDLGVRTSLTVPLKTPDGVLGTLCAHTRRRRTFREEEVRLLELIGASVAQALARLQALQAEQRRRAELEALRRASLDITSRLDLQTVFEGILEHTLSLTGANDAHLFLYDGRRLEFAAARWAGSDRRGPFANPRPHGLTYTVARSGERLVIEDAASHPLYQDAPWEGAIVGLPLKVEGRVLGVMNVAFTQPHTFDEDELRALELLGDQIAVALENARLYREATRQARQTAALARVAQHLLRGLSLHETLERILEAAQEALEADRAAVYLLDENTGALHCPASCGLSEGYRQLVCDRYQEFPGSGVRKSSSLLFIPDAQEAPELKPFQEAIRREGFHSYLVLPLLLQGRPLGALVVYWDRVLSMDADMLRLGQALADHAAVALERARQHEAVREAETRYRDLFDRVPVGLYRSTPEGRFLEASRALVEMFGYPDRESLLAADPEAIYLKPEDRARWQRKVERHGVVHNHEVRQRRHDGQVIWVRENAHVIRDAEGKVLYYEGTLEDITARKRAEQALRRSHRRLEKALEDLKATQQQLVQQERLAAIGQLAAGITHDFSNLLGAVVLYADLLREEPGLSEKGRERLETIQTQIRRAAALTEQILDFSRRSPLHPHALDLRDLVESTLELLSRTIPESIQVETLVEGDGWLVEADAGRLQQALTNLVLNARDAMPEGGRLSLRLDRLSVAEGEPPPFRDMPPGSWIRLTVSDTGSGIPPEVLPRIFEPFFTTKPPGQGTGLGLAQVYGIVKQHGGYIDVKSEVDRGTAFLIYLPAAAAPDLISEETSAAGQGEAVLVVEDDPAIRQAMAEVLTAHHYRALPACSAEEALSLFEKDAGAVDLVVTDLVMPGMSGLALCRELRSHAPALPIVVLTGYPPGSRTRELLERTGVQWAQKPVSPPDLLRLVREALDQAGAARET